jgi:hypothetical protein
MSRSRKKTPIVGMTTAESDKPFKRSEHSRERAAVRVALQAGSEPPSPRAFGDPARGEKDGKRYLPSQPELSRK